MSHSRISPSSSKRWMVCPGSVKLIEELNLTPNSSNAADLGTRIHALGEHLIKQHFYPKGLNNYALPEEILSSITKDDKIEANEYFNYVKSIADQDDFSVVFSEIKVDMPEISEELYGTVDCVIVQDKKLHIIDLKTGANAVSAEMNTQLMIYAYGVLSSFNRNPMRARDIEKIDQIELHIFQKNRRINCDNVNSFTISREKLQKFVKEDVKSAIDKVFSKNPKCYPSEKACQYCPASSKCKTLYESIVDQIKGDFETIEESIANSNSLEVNKIEELVEKKKMIKKFLDDLEEQLLLQLKSGYQSEKFKLVEKSTKRTWINEVEAYEFLSNILDEDEFAPRSLRTPTQCLELVDDDIKTELNKLIYKPEGELTIAPMSSKKSAKKSISDDFEKLS